MIGAEIGEAFQATALSGSLWLAIAVAAAAGIVAFLSPCVLPVVPGYLGYVSGLAGQSAVVGGAPEGRAVSKALARHRRAIGLLSGALLITIGVLLMTGVWSAWMNDLAGVISTFEPVV